MDCQHPLKQMIEIRSRGILSGICSICSANGYVIQAAMEKALETDEYVLIESTANQVNQYGGYTGMKPLDFRNFIFSIADKVKFPSKRIILGGDHLGPLVWKKENAESAMEKAGELIRQYVQAGFTKIHIDTSMPLADDLAGQDFGTPIIAQRGASLCRIAEEACREMKQQHHDSVYPVYVIGSEVPIPGGVQSDEETQVTRPSDFQETVEVYQSYFRKYNLDDAWNRVVGVVVQPGVEFGDQMIHEYDHEKALPLTTVLKNYPNLVFEGHSTDYQTPCGLRQMVADGIAILKVGPALTFALREALFAMSMMERELLSDISGLKPSGFIQTLEDEMIKNPVYWKSYYHGDEHQQNLSIKYSLSDRCRYYLPNSAVSSSIERLVENLKIIGIPLPVLSQYMPIQYRRVRDGRLKNNPEALIMDRIRNVLEEYDYAVRPTILSEEGKM